MIQTNGRKPPTSEIGASGSSSYSGLIVADYNRDLMGQAGIQKYEEMRRGDASVRAALRIIKAPILAGQWYFEPASNSPNDLMIADFVEWNWYNMSRTPIQYLWESLLSLDYGFYVFEKVFELAKWRSKAERARERTVWKWKKFGPRHPKMVIRWEFDEHGGVSKLIHNKKPEGYEEAPIPIEKLLIFTIDEEAGNPEGISILRSAYKHWYYKENLYKVDAISKERHGIGIPKATLQPNYTQQDMELANEMTEHIRTNEKAKIVLPPGIDVGFLELQGTPPDALASAIHHDHMILKNVLAQFLNLGTEETGSRAVGNAQADLFIKTIRYIADLIRGVYNKWAIPELVNYNFTPDAGYPELRVRRIGDMIDLRALSVALRNFVESGVITPDFEGWLRDYIDFPQPTEEAIERPLEQRLPKANYSNRVEMPTDGA